MMSLTRIVCAGMTSRYERRAESGGVQGGQEEIGEAVMRHAREPARLRLTSDRTRLAASGEDLAYILVEALDEKGRSVLWPQSRSVRDRRSGEIAGIGKRQSALASNRSRTQSQVVSTARPC